MINYMARTYVRCIGSLTTGGSAVVLQDDRFLRTTPIEYNQADRVSVLPLEGNPIPITFPTRRLPVYHTRAR